MRHPRRDSHVPLITEIVPTEESRRALTFTTDSDLYDTTISKGSIKQDLRLSEVPEASEKGTPSPHIVTTVKYKHVWKRLRARVKIQIAFGKLQKEMQLYGLSTKPEEGMFCSSHGKLYTSVGVEDNAKEPTESRFVLEPLSRPKLCWLCIYILLMTYTFLISPFNAAFLDNEDVAPWLQINLTVDSLFFIDILITFNSAYYDSSQTLVKSRKMIGKRYLKSWFFIDLIACTPLYLTPDSLSIGRYKNLLRLYRLPRLVRLLRLSTLFHLFQKSRGNAVIDLLNIRSSTFRLLSFVLTTVVAVHIFACVWYFVTLVEEGDPSTWVVLYNLQDSGSLELYLISLHWTVQTLSSSGFGDIVPCTSLERCVAMFWMSFALVFIAYTVGCLTAVVDPQNSKENQLTKKLAIIDDFSAESQLSEDLRRQLRTAVRNNVQTSDSLESEVLQIFKKNIPEGLRYEVALKMHHGALSEIPFFQSRDKAFTITIFPFLRSRFYQESYAVYEARQTPEHLFFIISGRCVVMTQEEYIIKRLWRGSYFGDIELILSKPRLYTVRAASDCELLTMNRLLLGVIKKRFQVVYKEMQAIASAKEEAWELAKSNIVGLRKRYKMERKHSVINDIREKRRESLHAAECAQATRLNLQLSAISTRINVAEAVLQETLSCFQKAAETLIARGIQVQVDDQESEATDGITDLESAQWSEHDIYSGYATPGGVSSR